MKYSRAKNVLLAVFRHSILIGLAFVILYPMLFMVSNAFKPYEQARDPSVIWIPKSLTLNNFKDVIEVMDYPDALLNTLTYTVLPTLLQIAVCMLVAYGFARFVFPGRKLLFAIVILTIIVPPISMSTGLFRIYNQFNPFGILGLLNRITGGAVPAYVNLIGTHFATILPALTGSALRSGLYILIFRQFFISMPKELEEAARVDGCGPFYTFLRIMAPNAQNIALTVLMLAIVWNWNDYYTAATYIRSHYTIATALHEIKSFLEQIVSMKASVQNLTVSTTRIQAACLLGIAPLLLMFLGLQGRLTESIETAGLTGI